MKRISSISFAFLALATPVLAGDVTASHAFARATAEGRPNGAAFMVLENKGESDMALVSASSDVAANVELHTHMMNDEGVMRMRQVPQIELPAGGKVILQPGSFHVMFMGLHQRLVEGNSLDVTLSFQDGSNLKVQVPVQGPSAMMPMTMPNDTHGSGTKTEDSTSQHSGSSSK